MGDGTKGIGVGCALAMLVLLASATVVAAVDNTAVTAARFKGRVNGYWTPNRMRNAKPFPLAAPNYDSPPATSNASPGSLLPPPPDGRISSERRPLERIKPMRDNRLFEPEPVAVTAPLLKPADYAAGADGAQYSSSRVTPMSADSVYPYATVGRLYFTVPAQAGGVPGDYHCTAAVISRRLILTAGHCLHRGFGGADGWYTNWRFIPAFRDGVAPFSTWDWSQSKVTSTWMEGGGSMPNAADYGVLVMKDRSINGSVRAVGDVVGWLGVETQHLAPNHVHMLAYPCNIDACNKMHQVAAQNFRMTTSNTVEYGSDMSQGSSGGPWVQNLGIPGVGQYEGVTNTKFNKVVGLVSYGFGSSSLLVQGSSIPDGRFWAIYDELCAVPGNCQ